jgi:xylulokinase
MGVILAAADALNWWAGVAGESASTLTGSLGALQAPSRTLFLPYLGGERTPHNDVKIRGQFMHLDHATDRTAMTRAVLEGVTHAFRDSFDALTGTGTRIDRLIGVGGGTKSDYWVQAIATSLGLPVDLPVAGDFGGAFGAARLGLMAATGAGVEACGTPPIARTVEPVAEFQDDFSESYARYRAGYVALRDLS